MSTTFLNWFTHIAANRPMKNHYQVQQKTLTIRFTTRFTKQHRKIPRRWGYDSNNKCCNGSQAIVCGVGSLMFTMFSHQLLIILVFVLCAFCMCLASLKQFFGVWSFFFSLVALAILKVSVHARGYCRQTHYLNHVCKQFQNHSETSSQAELRTDSQTDSCEIFAKWCYNDIIQKKPFTTKLTQRCGKHIRKRIRNTIRNHVHGKFSNRSTKIFTSWSANNADTSQMTVCT